MKYARILSRLVDQPLLLDSSKVDIINNEVVKKLLLNESIGTVEAPQHTILSPKTSNLAVINVFDSLTSKIAVMDSGFTSYESIQRDTLSAIDEGVSHIVYNFASPGGEFFGCIDCAEFLFSLPEKYGITTESIIEQATSAAYILASATQKISTTATSMAGSIAAIMTLYSIVEADKQKGVEFKILRSKSQKALNNPHESFSEEAIAIAEKTLSTIDNEINLAVTKFRPNLSLDTIVNLKGNSILGREALSLNLIDEIVLSSNDVLTSHRKKSFSTTKGAIMTKTLEELRAEVQQKDTELAALNTKITTELPVAVKTAVDTERTRILAIIEAGKTFSVSDATVQKRILAGTSKEDSISIFEDIKESLQAVNPVNTSNAGDAPSGNTAASEAENSFVNSLIKAAEVLDKGVAA